MKFARTFGLVVLAALAAMALVAASASAEATLCTKDALHQGSALCAGEHGKHVKEGSMIHAELDGVTKAVLTVTNGSGGTVRTVECSVSTITGTVTTTNGGGNFESLTFSGCVSAGCENVSASTPRAGKSFPWPGTVTWTGGTDGQLHVTGPSGKFTATCLGITATCEYETASATVTVTGGTPATVDANAVALERKAGVEFVCGAKADWTAKYTVTTPESLFVTSKEA